MARNQNLGKLYKPPGEAGKAGLRMALRFERVKDIGLASCPMAKSWLQRMADKTAAEVQTRGFLLAVAEQIAGPGNSSCPPTPRIKMVVLRR